MFFFILAFFLSFCTYTLFIYLYILIALGKAFLPQPPLSKNVIISNIVGNVMITSFIATFTIGGYAISHFNININDIVAISCIDIQKICAGPLPMPTIHIPILECSGLKEAIVYPIHYYPTLHAI